MHLPRHLDPAAAKRRDRSRSILPSTARNAARNNLASIRRHDRRAVNQALDSLSDNARCLCAGPEEETGARTCAVCDFVEPDYPRSDHKWAIYDRRGADKLGSVLRWARRERDAELAALGVEELSHAQAADLLRRLRTQFPDGVIGWHAMSHLRFEIEPRRWTWWSSRPRGITREESVFLLEALARWVLEQGLHHELNRHSRIYTAAVTDSLSTRVDDAAVVLHRPVPGLQDRCVSWRPLNGLHDVEAWASAAASASGLLFDWAHARGWNASFDPTARRSVRR